MGPTLLLGEILGKKEQRVLQQRATELEAEQRGVLRGMHRRELTEVRFHI